MFQQLSLLYIKIWHDGPLSTVVNPYLTQRASSIAQLFRNNRDPSVQTTQSIANNFAAIPDYY